MLQTRLKMLDLIIKTIWPIQKYLSKWRIICRKIKSPTREHFTKFASTLDGDYLSSDAAGRTQLNCYIKSQQQWWWRAQPVTAIQERGVETRNEQEEGDNLGRRRCGPQRRYLRQVNSSSLGWRYTSYSQLGNSSADLLSFIEFL